MKLRTRRRIEKWIWFILIFLPATVALILQDYAKEYWIYIPSLVLLLTIFPVLRFSRYFPMSKEDPRWWVDVLKEDQSRRTSLGIWLDMYALLIPLGAIAAFIGFFASLFILPLYPKLEIVPYIADYIFALGFLLMGVGLVGHCRIAKKMYQISLKKDVE